MAKRLESLRIQDDQVRYKSLLLAILMLVLTLTACSAGIGGSTREPVYIGQAELLALMIYPVKISLHITGDLPTACHEFHTEVDGPNAQNRIEVTAYSTVDPVVTCTQALEPFDESVPFSMQGQPDGTYSLWLNGDLVGEFEYSESQLQSPPYQ